MGSSAAFGSSGMCRAARVATLAGSASLAAAALFASSASGAAPARACPTASVVNAALGQHGKAPVVTTTPYGKTCTYPGGGISTTKITFQEDTLAQFNIDEKAVGTSAHKVTGLGQAAWTTNLGSLYVFDKGAQIKIVSLLTPTAKLEALARKLL